MSTEIQNASINLPADPSAATGEALASACRQVYAMRESIITNANAAACMEALRRAQAIERYLRNREQRDEARRAARVLECAVGVALGPAEVGRPKENVASERTFPDIPKDDRHRFRLMAEHRGLWEPELERQALTRKDVLDRIKSATASRPTQGETCTTSDLVALSARGDRFGVIYADPPWLYSNQGTRAATSNHYGGMTVDELCELPIQGLAADDAFLHLWTTNAFLFDCPRIMAAWGFEYRSVFVWAKPQMGIGNYWRVSHEFLLLGKRGRPQWKDRGLMSWASLDRARHSAKPERVRQMIERANDGPYLELFARQPAEGWACWGNEIEPGLLFREVPNVA